jgi:hypothetical protein
MKLSHYGSEINALKKTIEINEGLIEEGRRALSLAQDNIGLMESEKLILVTHSNRQKEDLETKIESLLGEKQFLQLENNTLESLKKNEKPCYDKV